MTVQLLYKVFAQDPDVHDIQSGTREQGIYVREIGDEPFSSETDVDEFDAGIDEGGKLLRNLSDAQEWAKSISWLEGEIVDFEIIE